MAREIWALKKSRASLKIGFVLDQQVAARRGWGAKQMNFSVYARSLPLLCIEDELVVGESAVQAFHAYYSELYDLPDLPIPSWCFEQPDPLERVEFTMEQLVYCIGIVNKECEFRR